MFKIRSLALEVPTQRVALLLSERAQTAPQKRRSTGRALSSLSIFFVCLTLSLLQTGCLFGRITSDASSDDASITLEFPPMNHEFDHSSYRQAIFRGGCREGGVFLLTLNSLASVFADERSLQKEIRCEDSRWSTEVDLAPFADGPFSFKLSASPPPEGTIVPPQDFLISGTLLKSKVRPEDLFVQSVRNISVANGSKLAVSPSGSTTVITYASDELCATSL